MNWNGGYRARFQTGNHSRSSRYNPQRIPIPTHTNLTSRESHHERNFVFRYRTESPAASVGQCSLIQNCHKLPNGELLALQLSLQLGVGQRQRRPRSLVTSPPNSGNTDSNQNININNVNIVDRVGSDSSLDVTSKSSSDENNSTRDIQSPDVVGKRLDAQDAKSLSYSPVSYSRDTNTQHSLFKNMSNSQFSARQSPSSLAPPSPSSRNQNQRSGQDQVVLSGNNFRSKHTPLISAPQNQNQHKNHNHNSDDGNNGDELRPPSRMSLASESSSRTNTDMNSFSRRGSQIQYVSIGENKDGKNQFSLRNRTTNVSRGSVNTRETGSGGYCNDSPKSTSSESSQSSRLKCPPPPSQAISISQQTTRYHKNLNESVPSTVSTNDNRFKSYQIVSDNSPVSISRSVSRSFSVSNRSENPAGERDFRDCRRSPAASNTVTSSQCSSISTLTSSPFNPMDSRVDRGNRIITLPVQNPTSTPSRSVSRSLADSLQYTPFGNFRPISTHRDSQNACRSPSNSSSSESRNICQDVRTENIQGALESGKSLLSHAYHLENGGTSKQPLVRHGLSTSSTAVGKDSKDGSTAVTRATVNTDLDHRSISSIFSTSKNETTDPHCRLPLGKSVRNSSFRTGFNSNGKNQKLSPGRINATGNILRPITSNANATSVPATLANLPCSNSIPEIFVQNHYESQSQPVAARASRKRPNDTSDFSQPLLDGDFSWENSNQLYNVSKLPRMENNEEMDHPDCNFDPEFDFDAIDFGERENDSRFFQPNEERTWSRGSDDIYPSNFW